MSLSDLFSDKVSSRVAAYAFAAAAVFGLEGCVTTGATRNVVSGVVNQQSYQLRKGLATELSHTTKCYAGIAHNCGQNNGGTTDALGTQRRYDPRNDPRFGY